MASGDVFLQLIRPDGSITWEEFSLSGSPIPASWFDGFDENHFSDGTYTIWPAPSVPPPTPDELPFLFSAGELIPRPDSPGGHLAVSFWDERYPLDIDSIIATVEVTVTVAGVTGTVLLGWTPTTAPSPGFGLPPICISAEVGINIGAGGALADGIYWVGCGATVLDPPSTLLAVAQSGPFNWQHLFDAFGPLPPGGVGVPVDKARIRLTLLQDGLLLLELGNPNPPASSPTSEPVWPVLSAVCYLTPEMQALYKQPGALPLYPSVTATLGPNGRTPAMDSFAWAYNTQIRGGAPGIMSARSVPGGVVRSARRTIGS